MTFQTKWVFILLLSPMCWCQQTSTDLTARTLFYRERPDNDQLLSVAAAKSRQTSKATATQATKKTNAAAQERPVPEANSPGSGTAVGSAKTVSVEYRDQGASPPAAQHLGLRYNLVLVDKDTGKGAPVEADRIFQPGECIALEFEANRSGYLYVLNQGSSGSWNPLLPSSQMPDEANIVKARTSVRVPQKYCFEIAGPPGLERIFVALARNPAELYDLHDSIKGGGSSGEGEAQPSEAVHVLTAENRLTRVVSKMQASMGARDLKITKIAQPSDPGEPPGSVYLVNASAGSSDRVVTEIQIKHE